MVRVAAIFRVLLCGWALAAIFPVAAQNHTGFNPSLSSYQQLEKSHTNVSFLPARYARKRGDQGTQVPSRQEVMDAIWNAAQHTGVDYTYLLAQAHLESGLNPQAKARTSSAAGLYQFIEGTWLSSLDRYREQLASYPDTERSSAKAAVTLSMADANSGLSREERLELRHDPQLAALVAAAYATENGKRLRGVLGRSATSTELYLAHFLGSGGASRFMLAWKRNPNRAAALMFPRAARSNRSIFYTSSGRARSLQGVLRHFEAKIDRAIHLFDVQSIDRSKAGEASSIKASFSGEGDPGVEKLGSARLPHSTISSSWGGTHASRNLRANRLQNTAYFHRFVRLNSDYFLGLPQASSNTLDTSELHKSHRKTCPHIEMCYLEGMSTSTITQVRTLIESGAYTKAGIARAAGLHANTLRDANEADWNPTAETLAKLQRFLDANDKSPVLVGAEEIIDEARNGRMYILVDDEDRENEGDLIIPAQMATPAAVNFMATHGRGLICLALDKARVNQLGLDPMSRNNKESMQTAFTVSIEAKEGVTTGISAADRARTISVAIDATKSADDIVTPGHVFPLMARDGGTLVRAGHTEAAVDISRLAGLNPSGVICEIMNDDGSMARLDDLIEFARKHDMKIGTIRDLIAYRMRNDHLVERVDESSFESDYGGQWRMITYRNKLSDNEAYVLQKGHITPDEPTLTRVHPISVFDDVLGAPGPRKRTLQRAMGAIGDKGAGVIVILTQRVGKGDKWTPDEEHRNIGIGSQILADLGVQEMTLLSNSRPDLIALEGFGISVTGHQPIPE